MIYSERVQNLSVSLIQALFKKKLSIKLDRPTAISLSNIGLPSEVCKLYNKKFKKNKDVKKTLLLLRMESIKYLNKLKYKNNILKKHNPLKYFFLRFFLSKKEYNVLKNKILKEFNNAKKTILIENKRSKTTETSLDSKVNNFSTNSFISSIQSLNNDIYELAKSNPKKAEDLAKLINQKFKSLEKIFIK